MTSYGSSRSGLSSFRPASSRGSVPASEWAGQSQLASRYYSVVKSDRKDAEDAEAAKMDPNKPDWKTFQVPEVPPPDDTAIEAELNKKFDITTLFQQMRTV